MKTFLQWAALLLFFASAAQLEAQAAWKQLVNASTDLGARISLLADTGPGVNATTPVLSIARKKLPYIAVGTGFANPSNGGFGTARGFELGVATCATCFATLADSNDVVFRAVGTQPGAWLFAIQEGPNLFQRPIKFVAGYEEIMTVHPSGKVGIGNVDDKLDQYVPETGPNGEDYGFRLYVEKGIRTERVVVSSAQTWPDYVFAPDYTLGSLYDLERHLQDKRHLPHVPPASEIEAKGLDLGNMDAALLRQLEELTLHTIAQQKVIDELLAQQATLKARLDSLENQASQRTKND